MNAGADARRGLVRRLSTQGWIHVVLVLNTVLFLVFAVIGGLLQTHADDQTADLTGRLQPIRAAFYQLETALVDQETGVRGYVLARDPTFLEPYTDGRNAEHRLHNRLERLIRGDPALAGDLRRLEATMREWRRTYAQPLISSVPRDGENAPGNGTSAPPASRPAAPGPGTAELRAGKDKFDGARHLFATLGQHIDALREQAGADAVNTRLLRNWAFLGMVGAFLVSGVVLAVLLHRIVGRPLRTLETSSSAVSAGAFDSAIRTTGPRDLEAVARAVEEMRRRIVTELSAARKREGLLVRKTAELDAQTLELQRSNAELKQFAYVASHDLQEPLRKVASFCQLLERRYGNQLDERARQYIAFAVDGAKRMQGLINDLLTFSRIGRFGDDFRTAVPLDEALDLALANLALAIEETGTVVVREGPLPVVEGNRTALAMLWQNLVGNAVKFRDPDRPPRIVISCEPGEGLWNLYVDDNGIGVPEEFGEKVFAIFQRLHTREEYEGTGIGLALCRKIVEHHGGRISLERAAPRGTRVRFSLPDRSQDDVRAPASIAAKDNAAQGADP